MLSSQQIRDICDPFSLQLLNFYDELQKLGGLLQKHRDLEAEHVTDIEVDFNIAQIKIALYAVMQADVAISRKNVNRTQEQSDLLSQKIYPFCKWKYTECEMFIQKDLHQKSPIGLQLSEVAITTAAASNNTISNAEFIQIANLCFNTWNQIASASLHTRQKKLKDQVKQNDKILDMDKEIKNLKEVKMKGKEIQYAKEWKIMELIFNYTCLHPINEIFGSFHLFCKSNQIKDELSHFFSGPYKPIKPLSFTGMARYGLEVVMEKVKLEEISQMIGVIKEFVQLIVQKYSAQLSEERLGSVSKLCLLERDVKSFFKDFQMATNYAEFVAIDPRPFFTEKMAIWSARVPNTVKVENAKKIIQWISEVIVIPHIPIVLSEYDGALEKWCSQEYQPLVITRLSAYKKHLRSLRGSSSPGSGFTTMWCVLDYTADIFDRTLVTVQDKLLGKDVIFAEALRHSLCHGLDSAGSKWFDKDEATFNENFLPLVSIANYIGQIGEEGFYSSALMIASIIFEYFNDGSKPIQSNDSFISSIAIPFFKKQSPKPADSIPPMLQDAVARIGDKKRDTFPNIIKRTKRFVSEFESLLEIDNATFHERKFSSLATQGLYGRGLDKDRICRPHPMLWKVFLDIHKLRGSSTFQIDEESMKYFAILHLLGTAFKTIEDFCSDAKLSSDVRKQLRAVIDFRNPDAHSGVASEKLLMEAMLLLTDKEKLAKLFVEVEKAYNEKPSVSARLLLSFS